MSDVLRDILGRHARIEITTDVSASTSMNALDSKAMARQANTEVRVLKQRMEKVMIITEALWTLLKEKTDLTDEDLKNAVRDIDLKDGKLDGRVAAEPPVKCPSCGNTIQKDSVKCIYCGNEADLEVFKR